MALETPKIFTGNRDCCYSFVPAPAGGRAEADATKEQLYAISTNAYCPQDGWVLPSRLARLAGHNLGILHNHGWSDITELPLGEWIDFEPLEDEIRARPKWSPSLDEKELKIKTRAAEKLLMVSVSFRVVKWHAPDPLERVKYGIPEDAHYAGVAEDWLMKEASFTATPADPDCGPRSTRTVIAARSVEYITREEKEASDTALKLAFKEMLDKGFANIQVSIQEVRGLIPTPTQRVADATNNVETCGSADGDVTQTDRAHGRSKENTNASLGNKRNWPAIIRKAKERNSTVTTNANSTAQAGGSENG